MKTRVFLGLGTNLGDRRQNIENAVKLLDERLEMQHFAISGIYETKSWGFDGPDFMNAVVLYELESPDPFRLLGVCKDIEREMGRTGSPQYDKEGRRIYSDRLIDIDILLVGDMKIDTPELKVPHPLMEKRNFVMRPLKELMENINN